MGEFFRSQPMTLIQLVIPFDVAHETVDELGKIGVVQFKDMNPGQTAPQRAFVNDVKRIDEMERKLRYFNAQLLKFAHKFDRPELIQIMSSPSGAHETSMIESTPIPELESELDDIESRVTELNQGEDGLKRMVSETFEKRYVLEIVRSFFDERGQQEQAVPLLAGSGGSSLTTIVGSIPRERAGIFERVLWRVTRGNIFFRMGNIEFPILDPNTDDQVDKNAFLILSQSSIAADKIIKICEAFGANTYDCPDSHHRQEQEIASLRQKENDLQMVLTRNSEGCRDLYLKIAGQYDAWRTRILKEKAIFHTMNLFQYNLGSKALIAEGWCPSTELEVVSAATQRATHRSGSSLPVVFKPVLKTNENPPTYFKTNMFTWAHQEIVDAYGIARYREINPTVFSVITFPFLFGVMFGDVGHGFLMLLFVAFMLYNEKEFMKGGLNEMFETCFNGRYIILLMSIFSIYNGFLYNECFSVPITYGSFPAATAWDYTYNQSYTMTLRTGEDENRVVFGCDPSWKGANNELYFYNSLKMKMSVLMGVIQMLLGISLSGINAVYRRKPYDFFFEFVPQVFFMLSIFGYLCILIVAKWFIDWNDYIPNHNNDKPDTNVVDREVPSLLNTLVNMFLSPGAIGGSADQMFSYQQNLQIILLILAIVCIPWMLLPKPFLLKREHENRKKGYAPLDKQQHLQGGMDGEEEEEEFEFQEVFIHQIIHTIEYVLGAISNTASYLRLWALSLAHSELSTVFWEKIMIAGFKASTSGIPIGMFIAFGAWAGLSFAVLMVMESLSAFLHALRLHWVEFQNKFYGGDGYKFIPFSYERILAGVEE